MLRQRNTTSFQVVGECYIHGMDDAVGLLGSLPEDWQLQITKDEQGFARYQYLHRPSGNITHNDPRLGPMPTAWKSIKTCRQPGDPALWALFRDSVNNKTLTSDPRLEAEALRKRGVEVEFLELQ